MIFIAFIYDEPFRYDNVDNDKVKPEVKLQVKNNILNQ